MSKFARPPVGCWRKSRRFSFSEQNIQNLLLQKAVGWRWRAKSWAVSIASLEFQFKTPTLKSELEWFTELQFLVCHMGEVASGLWIVRGFYEHTDNHNTCRCLMAYKAICRWCFCCWWDDNLQAGNCSHWNNIMGKWKGLSWRVEGRLHVGGEAEKSQRWPHAFILGGCPLCCLE